MGDIGVNVSWNDLDVDVEREKRQQLSNHPHISISISAFLLVADIGWLWTPNLSEEMDANWDKKSCRPVVFTLSLSDTQYSDMFPQIILVCSVCHFSGLTIICCVAISDPNSNKTNNKNKHLNPFARQNTVVIVTCKRTRLAWRRHWTPWWTGRWHWAWLSCCLDLSKYDPLRISLKQDLNNFPLKFEKVVKKVAEQNYSTYKLNIWHYEELSALDLISVNIP